MSNRVSMCSGWLWDCGHESAYKEGIVPSGLAIMQGSRTLIALVAAFAAFVAMPLYAQWTPLWSGAWQNELEARSAYPIGVKVVEGGRSFALLSVAHDGQEHLALARFDEGGSFVWMRESPGGDNPGFQPLASGLVVVADNLGPVVRVRAHDGVSGDVVWEDASRNGTLAAGEHVVVVGVDGGLMLPAIDGDDIVVIRYGADGSLRPTWRWSPGPEFRRAEDIIALPDGGAVLGVAGNRLSGGYIVVRFDAQGGVVFHDRELGTFDGGTFSRRLRLGVDADGNVLAQGVLLNPLRNFQAQVWKLAPDGSRLWTTQLVNPINQNLGIEADGFVLDSGGDALVAIDPILDHPMRLVRLDGATGMPQGFADAAFAGMPHSLVREPSGRLLLAGTYYVNAQGHIGARLAEFDAQLRPCRSSDLGAQYAVAVPEGGATGWTVIANTRWVAGNNEAVLSRYDAQGSCEFGDAIFTDAFEAAVSAD